jgi:hypothetical protein
MSLSNMNNMNNMLPITVPIPEPVRPGSLEQLAQIIVPGNKILEVYWMRSARQAICGYDGQWFVQTDQNILNGIVRAIKYEKDIDNLVMENLFIFENPVHGLAASDDMAEDFRECEWSDYGSDRISFHCTIREKNLATTASPTQGSSELPDTTVQANKQAPPVLARVTECCCTGCCVSTAGANVVNKNV